MITIVHKMILDRSVIFKVQYQLCAVGVSLALAILAHIQQALIVEGFD